MSKFSVSTAVLMISLMNAYACAVQVNSFVKNRVNAAYQKLEAEGRLHELSPAFLSVHAKVQQNARCALDNKTVAQVLQEASKHAPVKKAVGLAAGYRNRYNV